MLAAIFEYPTLSVGGIFWGGTVVPDPVEPDQVPPEEEPVPVEVPVQVEPVPVVPEPVVPLQEFGAVCPVPYFESSRTQRAPMTLGMLTKRPILTDDVTGSVFAASRMSTFAWSGVESGEWAKTAAARPETKGVAMLVQAMVAYLPPGYVEYTLTQGAATSTLAP